MKVKLGVFLPKTAPQEIVEGHKWHLMVEFNNGLHIAAQQHPNVFQKIILNMAIKHLEKKQHRILNYEVCLTVINKNSGSEFSFWFSFISFKKYIRTMHVTSEKLLV
ncbi:MAG: hypothetical protein ABF682_08385 [Liquorilactobacillus sp.]|uniref:hypothetical protein n=1 Tax=Liquorilactobacillus sp. TaxID=2767923 RepID=UPI0039EA7821